MQIDLPPSWHSLLAQELEQPYFQVLQRFVDDERQHYTVFPPEQDVFNALKLTPYENVNVLLLGQDPYHDRGNTMSANFACILFRGLCPSSHTIAVIPKNSIASRLSL